MDKCSILVVVTSIGWLLTVIGWFLVDHFSNNRETRKEVRAEINNLSNELEKLLQSSHSYYCSDSKVEQKISESEILTAFNKLDGIVERLEKFDTNNKLEKRLGDLYEAITGSDFGSDNVNRDCKLYTEKCQRFAMLTEKLRSDSESWYRETYQ